MAPTQVAWKAFFNARKDYNTKLGLYNTALGLGWAAYEATDLAERKKIVLIAEATAEKLKVTTQKNTYKSGTLDAATLAKSNAVSALALKNTAITDIGYWTKVDTRDKSSVIYQAAIAAEKIVTDKITRVSAIIKHMKDPLSVPANKGTLLDITNAKSAKDTEINAAIGAGGL